MLVPELWALVLRTRWHAKEEKYFSLVAINLLEERDKSEPDRIVGELLQPGGVIALYKLGLEDCVEEIDAIDVEGYAVFDKTNVVVMKYPLCQFFGLRPTKGKSFHHGRFIMRLREKCKNHPKLMNC